MAICLHQVGRRYRGQWVLANLSFALPAGARLLLTGANGAGKTTLLLLLATLVPPSVGHLRLLDQPTTGSGLPALRRRLGLLTHQHQFYAPMSGRENLQLVARLSGHQLAAQGTPLLTEVGLHAAADRPVATYSAGMQRRLGLARLLLLEPELVLLDEPFGQLDAAGVQLMAASIQRLCAGGATLVLATHDLDRGRALCDWRLDLGAGLGEGQPACCPRRLEAACVS